MSQKIIAVANQKGGVGKTTTAVNVATYLASFGRSVVIVDLDPQANSTSGLGEGGPRQTLTVKDVLFNPESIKQNRK